MTQAATIRADLQALFGEGYGRALAVTRSAPGAYDPATGATAAPTTSSVPGIGRIGNYRDGLVDGTNILKGDRRCTFVPDDVAAVIAIGDIVVDGTKTFAIINLQTRELNALIVYTAQVRS